MKGRIIAAIISIAASNADAGFYTYFTWQQLSPSGRAGYIAGMLDGYMALAYSYNYTKDADHYLDCLVRLKLTDGQLAEGIADFASTRPSQQSLPVVGVMINYLVELCGAPPR